MLDLHLSKPRLERPVRVHLIGAGGTGSHLFGTLMALDYPRHASPR